MQHSDKASRDLRLCEGEAGGTVVIEVKIVAELNSKVLCRGETLERRSKKMMDGGAGEQGRSREGRVVHAWLGRE